MAAPIAGILIRYRTALDYSVTLQVCRALTMAEPVQTPCDDAEPPDPEGRRRDSAGAVEDS
jgi:hypothetical protein